MNTTRYLVLIALTTAYHAVAAEEADVAAVDTSNWKCEYCVVVEGWSGELELGVGNVSDDSYKFGEYTGLNEEGGFFVGEATLYYRNPNASYLDLSISNVGLDSRSLSVEGGKQGSYKLFLNYDEMPHYISSTGMTPYIGSGSSTLTLPAGWTTAGTTTGMTDLSASLQPVNIETQRKRLGAGLAFTPGADSHWKYAVKFHQDTKEGNKSTAGSFFFNSAQLIEPIDYVTDEVDVSLTYNLKKWQTSLSYYASTFSNNNDALTWQNAYTPGAIGGDSGQLALPPENEFHQIMFSAGYELNDYSRISGDIAVGKMEQNDTFLNATQNTSLVIAPLPATSANAEVDTTDAKLRYMAMPTDKLRASASYTYNDRNNKTPQLVYDWVSTDTYLNSPRTNLPYSFTRNVAKIDADYQIERGVKLGVGYDMDSHDRTFQEVDETDENTLWGRVRIRNIEKMYLELKLARADRDTSAYQAVPEIDPPQNVLLRKYNMADRVRNTIGLHANITPDPERDFTIGLNVDIANDDYSNSPLGLSESDSFSIGADITSMVTETTSMHIFMGHENIESTQNGSETFTLADWTATNDDTVNNIGVGITHVVIEDKLDIGADYTITNSTGKTRISAGTPPAFPELSTQLDTFKLYANYRLKKSVHLRAAYWFESYDTSDWTLENVTPDTIPNVLSLGELTPSYNVNVIKLSMIYKF